MNSKIIIFFVVLLSLFGQSDKSVSVSPKPECPLEAELGKQVAGLLTQIKNLKEGQTARDEQITILKLVVAQKEAQLQLLAACLDAGIMPGPECDVNTSTLTVTRKEQKK